MATQHISIVDVDSEIQPDNSFPNAHAIYLILSETPPTEWLREFEYVCKLKVATRKRNITVVENRLRLVVSPTEHLESLLRPVQQAVHMTNERVSQAANEK